jgi:hypothetical protein
MNKTHIMKDPFYTPVLYLIEKNILNCDQTATAAGTMVNDSQVRSILNKLRKTAVGENPNIPNSTPREKILAGLHDILTTAYQGLKVGVEGQPDAPQTPLPVRDWLLCLETLEESIKRHSSGPGSRAYLDYLKGFLSQ